ncbi:UvrD-helicase domain-containing protein [Spongiactinospora sp. TRM90649]|uniref:UvrD-helicase domain-containing protein n=1 Tax=Spongiactinospora sp. TRM90649 TaxID=3031114 RepID=UPI0023F9293C|nr:UvrD-helicase domain-containing protein [Spongiactinospora sp. TRM90649]MDF5755436.1 AAA family ATPase [Spongiactinospora sp. TRM90649]
MPRLAISPEFPRELGALAEPVRRDVVVAIRRFMNQAPAAPHPEQVRNARDPRVATLRLADRHRGVVLRERDVYWLLTILPDGDAWSYARGLGFGVNPKLGVIEVWDAEALERAEPALRRSAENTDQRLFEDVCDTDLASVGIDPRLLPFVRHVTTEAIMEALEPLLPPTQYAPLAELARTGSLAAAWRVLDDWRTAASWPEREGIIDTADFLAALMRSPDRAAFVGDRDELDRVLGSPDWCVFLHPPQHRLSRTPHYDRPVLVTGGVGSGKTLIALHRAAYLATQGFGPVLLVTFSRGLSDVLAAKLDLLVTDDLLRKRVEVGNVDRLAHRIVTEAEGRRPNLVGESELLRLLTDATSGDPHSPAFVLREWEQVVLAQNLTTLEEYVKAERPGRSVLLAAAEREAIWRAISEVADRLRSTGRRTLLQLAAEASTLLSRTTGDLLDDLGPRREPYRHIVVDEAQDLHPAQWRLLRAAVPHMRDDLFIVGDPHQRISDNRVPLSSVGIEATPRRLKVSHRLPRELLSWSVRLRGGGPVDGLVETMHELFGFGAAGHGARPIVVGYDSPEAELTGLVTRLREWVLDDRVPVSEIAVAARGADLVREARAAIRKAGLGVRVSTLHGMKGLEFRRVAVIGVTDGIVPSPQALTPAAEDPAARAHDLQRERGLLYVACTRAGELLYVSHSGRASPFLPS